MKAVPGGTKMGNRTFEDVKSYVEWQSQGKRTVLSAKTEQHFDDLGVDVFLLLAFMKTSFRKFSIHFLNTIAQFAKVRN